MCIYLYKLSFGHTSKSQHDIMNRTIKPTVIHTHSFTDSLTHSLTHSLEQGFRNRTTLASCMVNYCVSIDSKPSGHVLFMSKSGLDQLYV